jgi:WD40 repeat protein
MEDVGQWQWGRYDQSVGGGDGPGLRTLTGHSDFVYAVAFSADGISLVSGSWDITINLWRVDTGELMASLIAFDEKDWVRTTPDGLLTDHPARGIRFFGESTTRPSSTLRWNLSSRNTGGRVC